MSVQGALIASATAPVQEVLTHNETARLFDFFDGDALVEELNIVLDDKALQDRLGEAARAKAVREYDLRSVCMPNQMQWVTALAEG